MPRRDGTGRLGRGKDCNETARSDRMFGRNSELNPRGLPRPRNGRGRR